MKIISVKYFDNKGICLSMETIEIQNTEKNEIRNITFEIKEIIANSGVKEGLCVVTIPHVSAGLLLAEDEKGIRKDYVNLLNQLVPKRNNYYYHDACDENGAEQLRSILIGTTNIIPISNGKLVLGDWQSILFIDMDGPRKIRYVHVTAINGAI
jgi:secondary thiamine-phosphate synthase enzyme